MSEVRKIYYYLFDMTPPSIHLDTKRHVLFVNGTKVDLPYKSWCVVQALVTAAPQTVSRQDLITQVWSGNVFTGEKGLNQALWQIRSALADNAKDPEFIQTIPRQGYKWIAETPTIQAESANEKAANENDVLPNKRGHALQAALALMTGIAALFAGSFVPTDTQPILSPYSQGNITRDNLSNIDFNADEIVTASTGTSAKFTPKGIFVEHLEGCKFYFEAKPTTQYGKPTFSNDGQKIAFRAQKPEGCQLVVFEFVSRDLQTFDACSDLSGSLDI